MNQRSALTRFSRILLTMGSGESLWLIVTFILGAVALGVFSNFVFSLAYDLASFTWRGLFGVVLALAVLMTLAYLAYRHDLASSRKPVGVNVLMREDAALPGEGLIWLLSLGSLDLPLFAIRYHHVRPQEPRLRHCWVLLTPEVQQARTFERLQARVEELGYDVTLHPVMLKADTAQESLAAVDTVYAVEAKAAEVSLAAAQIVSDMTGGNKQMTTGMVMACLSHGWPLEYVISQRDAEGKWIDGTQQAIRVDVDVSLK